MASNLVVNIMAAGARFTLAKVKSRVSVVKQKTSTRSYAIETRLIQNQYSEAVFLVNDYLKQDNTLQSFLGEDFNIFPNVAEEPTNGNKSYPYIRYIIVPGIGPFWRVRTDIIRYYVGDNSFLRAGKILQRLIELINIEESDSSLPLKTDIWKVQSLNFLGGTQPTPPDQDNGVVERGINVAIIYTQIN